MVKILVLFYSMYGHNYKMAKAVVEGITSVSGVEAVLKRVPETIPEDVLEKSGAKEAQKQFEHIAIAEPLELSDYDAVIFGTPTRFGNMAGQMRNFLDQCGPLWANGSLVGKVGSVFTSAANQHGGLESTILSFHISLLHLGFIVVGLPYSFSGQMGTEEIKGLSPYGASTIAGSKGERWPSEIELNGAKFQGNHVAKITKQLNK